MKFLVVSVIFYLAVASALPAKKSPSATRKSTQNIPESLTTFGLTTLAESVAKAGLVETLSGPGPFTVFAPTNDAFTNVDPATMKALQMDAALFKRVLTYHVVASNIESDDIKNELTSKSVAGDSLRLNVYKVGDKTVTTVNGATKIRAIETTNGVIYVIDKVLVPNDDASIVKVLEKQGTFSTLLTALKVADLTSTLDSPVPLTLFAPTDDAFRALPAGALDSLIAKPDELKKVLLAHVVSGTVYSKGLSAGSVPVVSGRTVEVTIGKSGVTVSNAQVTEADLPASNGVVHVISSVILLPTTLPAAAAPAVVVAKEAAPAAPAPIAEKPVAPAPIAAAPVAPKIAPIPPVAAPVPVAVAAPAPVPAVAPAAPKQTPAGSLKPAPAPQIIPEVLAANGLTTLVDSVVKAGLADALSGKGPFTVFAPTNDAFDAVDPAVMKSLQMDVNLLKRVLTYHVVGSAVAPSDVKNELVAKTLAGESLRVNVYGTGDKAITTINGAVRMRTISAANGIIYVIDKVLVPEKEDLNIVKILEKEGRFATLLTALKVAGLTDTVASPGPFTLFAPTDGAFRSLPEGALDSLIAKPEELKKVLLNHVVSGTVYSRGLVSGDVPVVGGGAVPAVVAKSGVSVANSQVIDADLAASNGVVHVINSVILSSSPTAAVKAAESTPVLGSLPEVLNASGLTALVELATQVGLAESFNSTGPFTIFAPTNKALSEVPPATLKALTMDPDLLEQVISYHIVTSALLSNNLENDQLERSLEGQTLRINVYGKENNAITTVNGAKVIQTLEASNGVVYIIDKVLFPEEESLKIIEVLEQRGNFSSLVSAIKKAGLTSDLNTNGPFTLFAPTDAAFEALSGGVQEENLKIALLGHVVSGTFYKNGLSTAGQLDVARGGTVDVTVSSSGISISKAHVIEADVLASNGVIHVIDAVIP